MNFIKVAVIGAGSRGRYVYGNYALNNQFRETMLFGTEGSIYANRYRNFQKRNKRTKF
ncbi:hypothetical protein [uncultured Clostridium sp.]|uniref:hypothetical protein n=1 Tax=uncultured Clostridium sp. TaxID=59620 RepID=UPI002582C328|nr:hypothetical protein [uncultured Clostridium sp.]